MKDLTKGNVYRNLTGLAIPILAGNLLQLTYNAVDSIVVGRYAGETALAAVNAVNRVDDFACIPEQSISHAIMNYTSQCDGARNRDKMREGFRKGMILELGYGIFICLVILFFRYPVIRLFGSGTMSEIGADYLKVMAVFYLMPAVTNGIQGFFRGIQKMQTTFIATCIQITLRVIFVYLLVPHMGMNGAAYSCAVGWAVMIVYQIVQLKSAKNTFDGYEIFWYNAEDV
ncbi:MAG TPA: oligosaccharide flippase family protein [Candidatus Mediterraneibacter stercoripullorum]|nr:oligosaccharide flippase family protein [Candidatus Mediterraneibacter stercoripullorum]